MIRRNFTPNWACPPGGTLEDLIEDRGWTQAELAERLGFTKKHVNNVIRGKASISADLAIALGNVLEPKAEFWLKLEAQYQADLRNQAEVNSLQQHSSWLSTFPIPWMAKAGWIRKFTHKGEQVRNLLQFFEVASVDAWHANNKQVAVAFRASSAMEKKQAAVAAWLCESERRANSFECEPFDAAVLNAKLPELRALVAQVDPETFVPKLRELCAACGVAVVFVPAPPGCPVHGATKWLSNQKAMLALSLRYKSDDQLWFSFFHEIAHILKHGKKMMFLEGTDGLDQELEEEADNFAQTILIPHERAKELSSLRSKRDVRRFAASIEIAPGVVVGRMQHEGLLKRSHMNDLKVRYRWA